MFVCYSRCMRGVLGLRRRPVRQCRRSCRPAHLSSPIIFTHKSERGKKAKTAGIFVHNSSKKGNRSLNPRAERSFKISSFVAQGEMQDLYLHLCGLCTVQECPTEGEGGLTRSPHFSGQLFLAWDYIHLHVTGRGRS